MKLLLLLTICVGISSAYRTGGNFRSDFKFDEARPEFKSYSVYDDHHKSHQKLGKSDFEIYGQAFKEPHPKAHSYNNLYTEDLYETRLPRSEFKHFGKDIVGEEKLYDNMERDVSHIRADDTKFEAPFKQIRPAKEHVYRSQKSRGTAKEAIHSHKSNVLDWNTSADKLQTEGNHINFGTSMLNAGFSGLNTPVLEDKMDVLDSKYSNLLGREGYLSGQEDKMRDVNFAPGFQHMHDESEKLKLGGGILEGSYNPLGGETFSPAMKPLDTEYRRNEDRHTALRGALSYSRGHNMKLGSTFEVPQMSYFQEAKAHQYDDFADYSPRNNINHGQRDFGRNPDYSYDTDNYYY